MKSSPLKLMAFTGAIALGFAGAKTVTAQTVVATLITSSAITTTDGTDMDFGTWLIQLDGTDTGTFTMNDTGAFSVVAAGTATTSGNSQVVNITAGAQRGTVLVQTPAAAVLQMTRGANVAFTDAAMVLTSITYATATEASAALGATATVPVTVVAAATDETVSFGGVITVGTAQPADATHTASFDVTFAY